MLVDNLKARCVDVVAREMARRTYVRTPGDGNASMQAFQEEIAKQQEAAAAAINEMPNIDLLDVIAEVLATTS